MLFAGPIWEKAQALVKFGPAVSGNVLALALGLVFPSILTLMRE
jgi:hypothetical protein